MSQRFALSRKCCLGLVFLGLTIALLTATTQAQTVSLSATSVSFGNVVWGTTSAIKKVTLTNTGTATLSISSVAVSADFLESNTCKSLVAAGAMCTISIAFDPPAGGTYSGTVTITDNASNSPQTITLSGSGINSVTVSVSNLTFGSFTVGTTSSPLAVSLVNNQTTALTISGISVAGDFAQTNNCGSSLAAGARCTINVTFTPTIVGTRTGTLTITDSGNNSPQTVGLSGTGTTTGLMSIKVSPINPSVAAGAMEQFHAKGTFTGGSTYDLTQSVTWSSSNQAVATISNTVGTQGLATALTGGTSTIMASISGISGSTLLTVTATLQSITVTPAGPSIAAGATQQFTAMGNYSDGSMQNLTMSVTWSSSNHAVATISNTSGSQGLATGIGVGTSTITATLGSVFSSTTLTVTQTTTQSTWTQEGPVPRFAHSAIYDPSSQQIVIFAGQQTSNSTNLNDVWLETTSLTNGSPLIFTALLPGGTAPAARFGHIATYDQTSNRMTIFGGGLGTPGPCANDVWVLDGANGQSGPANWLQLSPSGTAPNARVHHTGVYDPGSNTLTVFAGSDCNGHFFNDVWVLSNANGEGGTSTWTELAPSGPLPAAREGSSAIYDSTNHIMTIYGGDAGGGSFGDVWVLSNANGQGGTPAWTQLSPTGTAPHVRTGHSAVYDSVNNRMIVFGGNYATTTLGDTWILSSPNGLGGAPAWTQPTVAGTAPIVEFHSAVYSQALNNMYVFAGTSSTNKLQTSNHSFTLTEANGLQSGPQWYVAGPPVRYSQSAFYDPATGGLFVYAGQHTYSITYSDYDRDTGVMSADNLDWTKLSTSGTSHPVARFGHTGLYDSSNNRMMVFGGSENGGGPCLNDYWILSNANTVGGTPTWLAESPSGTAPAARMRHASVYDSTTNSLIIFGGFDCTSTYFNDVWILSDANSVSGTPAWTNIVPLGTPPSARENAAAVYDSTTNSLILFGGDAGTPMFNDVWVLSHANGTGGTPAWTQLTVSGTGPSARTGHSAVYDSVNSRMVIYGGWNGTNILSDTWVLANANSVAGAPTWIPLATTTPGPARYDHSAVYDPVSNQMVIFGGYNAPLFADANIFSLTNANGSNGTATLVSIAISPQNPTIDLGNTQQFTATGTYSDGTNHDITTSVTWASSMGTVATISNAPGSNGLATSVAVGSTIISATLGTISSSTTLTVGAAATLVSITVTPTIVSLDQGLTQQFTATGNYSDGTMQNITDSVTWSSSGAAATVTSTGLATAAQLGSANVIATSGSISGSGILVSILTGAITAFPDGTYFPPTLVGTTSTVPQTAVVYNLGSTNSTITNIALTGSTAFKLISGTYPITLAPNASTTYTFSFTPTTSGSVSATATFSFSTTGSQTVTLNGQGVSTTAVSSLNTNSVAFGNQPLGTTSPAQTITINNTGTSAFTIESVTTTLPFLQTGYTSPVKVNGGSSFTFQVQYVPFLLGEITGTISLTYDVLPNQGISLSGTGTAATALGISTFPTLPVATQGGAYQATLTAAGGVGQTNWTVASGSLPTGLTLSSSGLISGTVSSSVALANYSFVVQVTDSNNPPDTASLLVTMSVEATTGANCNNISWDVTGTTSPLVAITDLGTGYYEGTYQGGLYANGNNVDDPTHHAYGISMGQSIQPLDINGNPDPNGNYVLLTIGHSNTEDVSDQLVILGSSDPVKNPSLVLVNGGTGSSSADELQDPSSYFWGIMTNSYLPNAGVSPLQVEIVWLNDVDVSHPPSIPGLQGMLENIARNILTKFPNTKILYLSSVNYTAYSNGVRNAQPEPTAYETGFAAKAVIQDQENGLGNMNYNPANGPVVAPWTAWAAYYWTNGLLGRNDGLTWSCQDNIDDGVHPATPGRVKAAAQLLNFLKTDDTSIPWF